MTGYASKERGGSNIGTPITESVGRTAWPYYILPPRLHRLHSFWRAWCRSYMLHSTRLAPAWCRSSMLHITRLAPSPCVERVITASIVFPHYVGKVITASIEKASKRHRKGDHCPHYVEKVITASIVFPCSRTHYVERVIIASIVFPCSRTMLAKFYSSIFYVTVGSEISLAILRKPTYTVHVHCAPTLCSYSVCINCARKLCSYIVLLHCACTLCTYTVLLHCARTVCAKMCS